MIMISDMTLHNVTAQAEPSWMKADRFGELLRTERTQMGLWNRLTALLKVERS